MTEGRAIPAGTLLRRWREAFLLPGYADPEESAVTELADTYGIPVDETMARCRSATADSKAHWEAAPRDTPAEIAGFYDTCHAYAFEHMYWHATFTGGESLVNAAAVELGLRRGARRALDFGGGVGTNALMFARAGFETWHADLSGPLMDFTRGRFERRGLPPPRFVDLRSETLPEARFDLVTVVDVLEHVPDPLEIMSRIARSLAPGGRIVVAMGFGQDPDRPMHIVHTPWRFLAGARSRGLALRRPAEFTEFDFVRVYERADRSVPSRLAVVAADTIAVSIRRSAREAYAHLGAARRALVRSLRGAPRHARERRPPPGTLGTGRKDAQGPGF